MTIAIGLIASDGIVLAADTQLTQPGFLKSDEGKLSLMVCPVRSKLSEIFRGLRTLGITGSGNAQYVKEMSRRFSSRFSILNTPEDEANPHAALQSELSKMHEDHIVPFDRYPTEERPEIFMILGAQVGFSRYLWSTEKNLLVPESNYAAVGIGASYAKILLQKFYPSPPLPNLVLATLIAAYVIFNVKEMIDGCGKGTDIFLISESTPSIVFSNEIKALEEMFRKYERLEHDVLMATLMSPQDGDTYRSEQLALVRSDLQEILRTIKIPSHQWSTDDSSPLPPSQGLPGGSDES